MDALNILHIYNQIHAFYFKVFLPYTVSFRRDRSMVTKCIHTQINTTKQSPQLASISTKFNRKPHGTKEADLLISHRQPGTVSAISAGEQAGWSMRGQMHMALSTNVDSGRLLSSRLSSTPDVY